jgi:hypothetical protein
MAMRPGFVDDSVRRGVCVLLVGGLLLPACGFLFSDGSDDDGGMSPDGDPPEPPPVDDPGTEEEAFTGQCVPDAWIEDARDVGAPGALVSFDLRAQEVAVAADRTRVHSVLAPLQVAWPMAEASVVVFPDAVVEGGPQGTVVVVGAQLNAGGGSLSPSDAADVELDGGARVELAIADDDGERPDLGADADPGDVAALASAVPVDVAVAGLELEAYERAYVVSDGVATELPAAFEVSASRIYWPRDAAIYPDAVEAGFDGEVFIGLTPLGGELVVGEEKVPALPMAILGRDAELVVGPGVLRTVAPMPVRQALDDYGALIPAVVQLRLCEPKTMVMRPGETRIVELAVREKGGLTDAAFNAFRVEDDAGTSWDARIELDPTLPARLTTAAESNPGTQWGRGLADFVEAWAEAAEAITKGIICVFTLGFLCPDDDAGSAPEPTPLAPYPAWADAMQVYVFEVELTAPGEEGTHAVTFTAEGQNYEATIEATIVVE